MYSRPIYAAAALMAMIPVVSFDDGHRTGPGTKNTGARGRKLDIEPTEHTRSKPKSESLRRLLRK